MLKKAAVELPGSSKSDSFVAHSEVGLEATSFVRPDQKGYKGPPTITGLQDIPKIAASMSYNVDNSTELESVSTQPQESFGLKPPATLVMPSPILSNRRIRTPTSARPTPKADATALLMMNIQKDFFPGGNVPVPDLDANFVRGLNSIRQALVRACTLIL